MPRTKHCPPRWDYVTWDWYCKQPARVKHKGVAYYDKQRASRPLPTIIHPREFDGYDQPPSWLKLPASWVWTKDTSFHGLECFVQQRNECIEPANAGIAYHDASFEFVDVKIAAKLIPAIDRLRDGRFPEKDLPRHISNPPKQLSGYDQFWFRGQSRRQRWDKPDKNGQVQLAFPESAWTECRLALAA